MTTSDQTAALVHGIMQGFARLTGLSPLNPSPKRYLWTDAFAVCNYLGLYRRTDDPEYRDLGNCIPVLLDLFRQCLGEEIERDRRSGVLCHGHQATPMRREDILGSST